MIVYNQYELNALIMLDNEKLKLSSKCFFGRLKNIETVVT